jgi:RNA polymerase sigma-70 factor, ECF subfamily
MVEGAGENRTEKVGVDVNALKVRDRHAWHALYEAHADSVYRYALYRVRGDRALAEDVTQETFTRAIESIETFRGDASGLLKWLRGIAKRVMARRARSLVPVAARPLSLDTLVGDNQGEQPAWTTDPERQSDAAMMHEEEQQLTGAALTALPERWEEVLRMKYCEGLRVMEIVQRLDSTPKAVESLLSRARAAFRATYARMAAADGDLHAVQDWHDE